jgi:hypothetical protein
MSRRVFIVMAMAGYACWWVSDVIELLTRSYGAAVVYLTALFHLLVGIGIWGLAAALAGEARRLLWASTLLVSLGHLSLMVLPLHVHWSGLGSRLVVGSQPLYLIALLLWSLGIIVFSVRLVWLTWLPAWVGWSLLAGFSLIILSRPLGWPMPLINLITIALSSVLLYLGLLCLRPRTKA